jgi:hypothetical protein
MPDTGKGVWPLRQCSVDFYFILFFISDAFYSRPKPVPRARTPWLRATTHETGSFHTPGAVTFCLVPCSVNWQFIALLTAARSRKSLPMANKRRTICIHHTGWGIDLETFEQG